MGLFIQTKKVFIMNKKFMFLKEILMVFMMMGVVGNVWAGDEKPVNVRTNWTNSMAQPYNGICLQALEDNLLIITTCITVTDDGLENYPPLYLRSDFDGIADVQIVDIVQSIDDSVDKPDFFEKCFVFEINVGYLCEDLSIEENKDGDTVIPMAIIPYTIELVTPNGNGYEEYPVFSFTGSGELFDIEILEPISIIEGEKDFCCTQGTILSIGNLENNGIENDRKFVGGPNGLELLVEISPNPFKSYLNLDFFNEINSEAILYITDISGKEVFKERLTSYDIKNNSYKISTQSWNNGVYFISIFMGENHITKKLIK